SEGEIYVINPETCIDCGACSDVCPTGVIAPEA
ncbi:MAG: 4Fe-4S binding protein, partial [Alloprevotella sp.]|nr:4Fe-4S binding protein [Alloprevotella sp.]